MRACVLAVLIAGCSAPQPTPVARTSSRDGSAAIAPSRGALAGLPDALVFTLDLAHAELSVVDVPPGDHGLDRARREAGASLAINAGFFDPSFAPEGLVVSGGVETSTLVPSLSGGVLSIRDHLARLEATESYAPDPLSTFAVQCRPRLVVASARNIASDDGRRAARTALCIRAAHQLDIVVAPAAHDGGPTLYQLAEALVSHGCTEALNLDGGPSTGIAWHDPVGPSEIGPRGPVRQAIVVRL